jgi:hypothetical protein
VFVDTDTIAAPTGLTSSNNSNYEQLNLVNSATSHDVLDTITPVSATLTSALVGNEDGATVTYTMTLGTAPTSNETFTFMVGGVEKTITVLATQTTGTTTVTFSEPDVFVDTDTIAAPTGLTSSNNSNYEQLNLVNSATSHDVLDTTDTTTVTLSTANVPETADHATFTITLSNPPQGGAGGTASVTITNADGTTTTRTVAIGVDGIGTFDVTFSDNDVYYDANSISAEVTAVTGNFENVDYSAASATSTITEVQNTTTVASFTQSADLALAGSLVTYTVTLSNEVRAGDNPVTVTLTNGTTDYTVTITSGYTGAIDIALPTTGVETTISIKSVTQTSLLEHSFESLSGSGSVTTLIDYPPVEYAAGAKWQVQSGVIQPKGGDITFNSGGTIHFDLYVKEGTTTERALLSLDPSKAFSDSGLTASVQKIFSDSNESIFRVTLVNTTNSDLVVSQNDQLGLKWAGVSSSNDDVRLINSDEYVLLNNDGNSIKLATETAYGVFADSTGTTAGDERIWLSDSTFGGELVNGTTDVGDAGQTVAASGGDDIIYGNSGTNKATLSNDTLNGGDGNDLIDGRAGTDTVDGGAGNDSVFGGLGNDLVIGGSGNDILGGGYGSDTFKWSLGDQGSTTVPAADVVKDFSVGSGGDVLDLRDLLQGEPGAPSAADLTPYLHFSDVGGKAVLSIDHDAGTTFAATQTVTFDNMSLAQLQSYAGGAGDDAAIIAKLLTDGNLKAGNM